MFISISLGRSLFRHDLEYGMLRSKELSKARQILCPHPSDVTWNYLIGKIQKSAGVWRPYCSHCGKWLTREQAGPPLEWKGKGLGITVTFVSNSVNYNKEKN